MVLISCWSFFDPKTMPLFDTLHEGVMDQKIERVLRLKHNIFQSLLQSLQINAKPQINQFFAKRFAYKKTCEWC